MTPFQLVDPSFPVVVSGPSGVGKTVLCQQLCRRLPRTVLSVSATTRAPRAEERDGESYFFWSMERFETEREAGGLAESALVHGHWYGTPRRWLDDQLAAGRCVILNIDVQGGKSIRSAYPDAVLAFILPPSREALARRLRGRASDAEEEVRRRLRTAEEEFRSLPDYDYAVVNDVLETAAEELIGIVRGERTRVSRRVPPGWSPARAWRDGEEEA